MCHGSLIGCQNEKKIPKKRKYILSLWSTCIILLFNFLFFYWWKKNTSYLYFTINVSHLALWVVCVFGIHRCVLRKLLLKISETNGLHVLSTKVGLNHSFHTTKCAMAAWLDVKMKKKIRRNASIFYHYDLHVFIALLTGAMLDDWRIIIIRQKFKNYEFESIYSINII
jgi:hypothetical protein